MENKAAIEIQKLYRGYITRKRKNTIFKLAQFTGGYVLSPKPSKHLSVDLSEWGPLLYPTPRKFMYQPCPLYAPFNKTGIEIYGNIPLKGKFATAKQEKERDEEYSKSSVILEKAI